MVNKFLIAIAGIVAVMAALVLVPSFSPTNQTQLKISYVIMHIVATETGAYEQASTEILAIENDGSATYKVDSTDEQRFSVSGEEMKRLRALMLETGFMQIPATDYEQKGGPGNFTKYALTVQADDDTKTITWVNPEAHDGTIPPIIINTGSKLDAIIERHV